MTNVPNNDVKYLMQDDRYRPQLISRHSSSLPVEHRTDVKKKALSRRSRSASPCVKKTNSSFSGNLGGSPKPKYTALNNRISSVNYAPVIRKQNLKPLRVNTASAKQRAQVLTDHKKSLSIPSVWEKISSTHGDYKSGLYITDVNSNITYATPPHSAKPGKQLQSTPLSELPLDDNLLDDCSEIKNARQDRITCRPSPTTSLFDILLPIDCKLKIFTYLSQREKGQCMLVSTSWYNLVRSPQLWRHVNLREFSLCYTRATTHSSVSLVDECTAAAQAEADGQQLVFPYGHQCSLQCYGRYIQMIEGFISFLIDVRPVVKSLQFSFDLICDNWMATVNRLIMLLNLNELEYADMNWRDTPVKPSWLATPDQALNDVLHKTRRRQRKFLDFLEDFVQEAPNVKSLVLPFEWSSRAILYLVSLKKLRNLTLEKYFVFQRPCQDVLDSLGSMPSLERLVLEIWTPSSTDMIQYSIKSQSLKYLDLSQCRGFYLKHVDLPQLEVFIDERKPWNGPLTFPHQVQLSCLGDILSDGAPKLRRINNISLSDTPVDNVLRSICPCRQHKAGITM